MYFQVVSFQVASLPSNVFPGCVLAPQKLSATTQSIRFPFFMIRILGRGSNLEYLNLLSDPSLYLLSYIACLTSVFSTKQNKPGITNNERERLEHYSYKTRPWLTSSASFQFPQGWDYRSEKTRHLWDSEAATMYNLKGQSLNMWTGQGLKYGLVHSAGLSCRPV